MSNLSASLSKAPFLSLTAQSLNREQVLTLKNSLVLIVAVGLFAHWPALISDSNMWDDWIILAWITQKRLDWMFQFFNNYGVAPYCIVYFPFVTFFNDPATITFIAKIINLLGVTINGSLIMLISKRVAHENLIFAILAGISAVCFPALSGEGFHLSAIFYYVFIPLFLMGILLFIEISKAAKFKLTVRLLALTTLFFSFSLNSLLVLFYALIPAVFYASLGNEKKNLQNLFVNLRAFLTHHLDFLLLPFAFWIFKETFMPRQGVYLRYNKLHFDWSGIFHGYEQLIPNIMQTTLFFPFSIQFIPWIAAIAFFLVIFSKRTIPIPFQNNANTSNTQLMILFCFGIIALCGAALPYYMVGRRSFQTFGFMSRDNALFPLGISWITAAFFCIILKPQAFIKSLLSDLIQQRIVLGIFCSLIVAQSISNWRNHADWQAHHAYYRSAVEKITQDKSVIESSVIHVVDNIPGGRTLQTFKYPTSIWSEILSAAFHKTTRLAISVPPENGRFFTQTDIDKRLKETEVEFMFTDINLQGKQSRVIIDPTNSFLNPILLTLAYWKARFVVPSQMPQLLDSLTRVTSEPIRH